MRVGVQPEPFDLSAELAGFGPDAGAIVTFSGLVRGDGGLVALEIEHYPGMTERALTEMAQHAIVRFHLVDATVIHRHGRIAVGDQIMMVATAARHRADAFEGAQYLMDYLKSRAPFWKREIGADGPGEWVAAKSSDEDALGRWA